MPTVHLRCPHCRRNLRCSRLIAPGEPLRCSHCGSWFRAGIDDAPPTEAGATLTPPRRGFGILLAWLLFISLLSIIGGSIATAVAVSHRERPRDATTSEDGSDQLVGWTESSRPTTPVPVRLEDSAHPTSAPDPPIAPPKKPAPPPTPPRTTPVDPPKPPPLAEPQRPAKQEPAPQPAPPAPPEAAEIHWLPPDLQKQADSSIDKGVEFLRRQQHADGSWGHQTDIPRKRYTPGITALSALTLLECGVPAKDEHVRSAARFLRQHVPELTSTYSIALAILFFDRLGDESDTARIRTLALRLIAGQKTSGGWDYSCPTLNRDEELGLLALLYKDRPTSSLELFALERKNEPSLDGALKSEEGRRDTELYRPKPSKISPLELFTIQDRSAANKEAPPSDLISESVPPADKERPKSDSALPGDNRRLTKRAMEAADKLPEKLRRTPALRVTELMHEPPDLSQPRNDNSNTQFAILGLLAAENYDVPMERAMALLDWRFRNSMTVQGGWNYRPNWETTPSMTAAALMGLALKHGILLPNRRGRGRNVTIHDDEIIHRGFLTLTGMLENYYAGFVFNQLPLEKLDLYCLWTVERVAVLYNQRELGGLEWYPAGVQLLLPLQREDGSWSTKGTTCLHEASVASSFALLFLKRSNLARGLSERLNASVIRKE